MPKIVFFHLFNDFSGSPKVLSQVISGVQQNGRVIDIITSSGKGALTRLKDIPGVNFHTFSYKFYANKVITALNFIYAQIYMFLYSFRYIFDKDVIFYINTLLPVGALISGKLQGKRIICHYHENAYAKGLFYKTLSWLMQKMSMTMICVSEYQRSYLSRKQSVYVVNNALDIDYNNEYNHNPVKLFNRKTILLLGSLKRYKGIYEFLELARMLPEYRFNLVVSDTQDNLDAFINSYDEEIPENIELYSRQADVRPFYQSSSVLLNLSDKRFIVETFGLTAIEAMAFGVPVIVPTVGGIAELVTDGYNGYKIDALDLQSIKEKLLLILTDFDLYKRLSDNAYRCSSKYSYEYMIKSINEIITQTQNQ